MLSSSVIIPASVIIKNSFVIMFSHCQKILKFICMEIPTNCLGYIYPVYDDIQNFDLLSQGFVHNYLH